VTAKNITAIDGPAKDGTTQNRAGQDRTAQDGAAEETALALGWRVYSLGVMAIGALCLAFGEFDPGQPVPDSFSAHSALPYVVGAFLMLAAGTMQFRRSRRPLIRRIAAWGSGALAAYYTLVVVLLMDGRVLIANLASYGGYEEIAIQMGVAAGAVIVFAAAAGECGWMSAAAAVRVTRVSQLAYGVCALVWGGAHFIYMNLTAPLVPKWLPPTQEFWGYVTGAAFCAAGIAILTGVRARLAAVLLTVMLACFAVLVHTPILLADHKTHFNWTESAENLAAIGAAWVMAGSLRRRERELSV
jgi:hypothetical protein